MSLLRLSVLRAGQPRARVTGALGWIAALLLSHALGACSTTASTTQAPVWYGANAPGQVAGLRSGPPVEIEDDGIETQRPPLVRAQKLQDDPTQPYSPNYGSVPRA
jgi:hypothetical protein